MTNKSLNTITIEISHHQDFINGTSHNAYLVANAEDIEHRQCVPLIIAATDKDLLEMMDCLSGIKIRLEELGKEVKVVDKVFNDPNFETQDEAEKWLQEM